jgi:hypothetical protein
MPRKLAMKIKCDAVLAQLVEHDLAKVGVTSSSLVYRSKFILNKLKIIKNVTRY